MIAEIVTIGTLLTADNCSIDYRHYQNNKDKVIVIAHGFYNSKDAVLLTELAKYFFDEYDVFMFDFRGHGKSGGLYSWTAKENQDLNAALNYLKGKYKKTGLLAFSLGGSVSINVLAQRHDVDSLVCVSTPSDFSKIDYQFWNLDLEGDLFYTMFTKEGRYGRGFRPGPFWLTKEKPIDNINKVTAPVLYIHGEKDWVIKPWHSKALYEKTILNKKLVIIKNGPHAEYLMKDSEKEFVGEIKNWFNQTLAEVK
ncbi:MAG: alpha/beta hydrolase [Candidatus Omnitrophica bacterium]|jgi:pimeloyl-ACP methyl ester carboxylesterase|nr:alpha/beta hydrolase [Candidatus Omnitrophota bacterium]